MIYLDECNDRCFADKAGQCNIMAFPSENCDNTCPFYKPRGCADWIRTKRNKRAVIFTPEELERRQEEYEKDRKHRSLYWQVKRAPKG